MIYIVTMTKHNARCDLCGHSVAAHLSVGRCVLCECIGEERQFVQQSLLFRSALPRTKPPTARKR
jgi:hypothetical protein